MALAPNLSAERDLPLSDAEGTHVDAPELRVFVLALFFIFGGITSLNDVIIPKLKDLFTLSYTQAMLVQFCFFTAYALFSLPAAAIVRRAGYMRTASIGLVTMMVGCLLFIPAAQSATFAMFLVALFVLGAGITIVQVVANPLISLLGPARTAHSRLSFAQGFNSLGTVIFPAVGAGLILGNLGEGKADALTGPALAAHRMAETQTVVHTYTALALALLVVAGVVWANHHRLKEEHHESSSLRASFALLRNKRFGLGALCIFLYVGAEVSIGSLIVNYLKQPKVLGLNEAAAGLYIPWYWGGTLVGRFVGSAVLRVVSPGKVLACNAMGAIALILIAANASGHLAAASLLLVGLMNSIMFPTIFSLACKGLGRRAADGSGIINIAIFGGAVVPILTGALADLTGSLSLALALPALCYAVIAHFGYSTHRSLRA